MKTLLVVASLFILAGCETYSVGGTVPVDRNVRVTVGVHSGYYHRPYLYQRHHYYQRPVIIHQHVHPRPRYIYKHKHRESHRHDRRHRYDRNDRRHDRYDNRRHDRRDRDRRRNH